MRILIFGITSQDGQILADILFQNKVDFLGIIRQSNIPQSLRSHTKRLKLCDFEKTKDYLELINEYNPTHVINLIGQSSVGNSFKNKEDTYKANYQIAYEIGEYIYKNSNSLYFVASSAYIFDCSKPISYNSKINAISPYAKSKAKAYEELKKLFKEKESLFFLHFFNHTSKFSDERFILPKLIKQFKLSNNNLVKLKLGNIKKIRNWGLSEDYMKVIFEILKKPKNIINKEYFIGSDFEKSIEEIIFNISKTFKKEYIIESNQLAYRPHDPEQVIIDPNLLISQNISLPNYKPLEFIQRLII